MQTEGHKQFIKILSSIDHSCRTFELFNDFCGMFAHTLALPFYGEASRQKLQPLFEKYGRDKLGKFDQLVDLVVNELEADHQDFLGDLYGQLELGNTRIGQFFTPYTISLLTARMTMEDVKSVIEEKGFIRLCEPASGSGGMVIAARQVLIEQQCNPSRDMFVVMVDVSEIAFLMSYIQASLYGLAAEVVHGDSLSMKVYQTLHTPVYFLERWHERLAIRRMAEVISNLGKSEDSPTVETKKEDIQLGLF